MNATSYDQIALNMRAARAAIAKTKGRGRQLKRKRTTRGADEK